MVIGFQQSVGLRPTRHSLETPTQTVRAASSKEHGEVRTRNTDGPFFNQKPPDPLRTGFGKGTVSVPSVTVRTLGDGMDGARNVVPTVEQLQEEHRTRLEEQRREAQRTTLEERTTRPVDVQVLRAPGEAAAQTQSLVNRLDQAAQAAQARVSGESPPAEAPTATVRVNGQAINYLRAQTGAEFQKTPTFNVLV
jgi:hypothetical protein